MRYLHVTWQTEYSAIAKSPEVMRWRWQLAAEWKMKLYLIEKANPKKGRNEVQFGLPPDYPPMMAT
jgi:hypothetical protein